jgi:hypothetical protein
MLHFNSLVVGLVTAMSIAAPAQAFSPVISPVEVSQPDKNLHAQLTIIFGNPTNPAPRPQPIVIETQRYPEPVIYREVSRDPRPEFHKRGHGGKKHHKHFKGRDQKHYQYDDRD